MFDLLLFLILLIALYYSFRIHGISTVYLGNTSYLDNGMELETNTGEVLKIIEVTDDHIVVGRA